MTGGRVRPWPARESVHPTCAVVTVADAAQALHVFERVARSVGYRTGVHAPGHVRAVLGRRWLNLVAETVGLPPVRPFLHVELDVVALAAPTGTRLQITCGRGGQELGVATRVAGLVERLLAELDAPDQPAQVSAWASKPPA